MELMAANAQWSSRPDDQRFTSLEDLEAAVERRRQISRSRVMPLARLGVEHDEQDLFLVGHNDTRATMTHWSFGQLATAAKAPAAYLRSLPPAVAEINLEYGLKFGEAANADVQLYYTQDSELGEIRAATGPKYGRIYDSQLVRAVRKMNADDRWTVPSAFNARDFTVDRQNTTLYASDRDVWMFLVDEAHPIQIGEQTYFRGFYTWNSEVGKATFGLASFLYSYVCCNRIIWGARDFEELRIRHTHLAPERFIAEATPALKALADSSAQPIVDAIRKAQATRIAEKPAQVEKWLEAKGFGKFETKVALQLAATGGSTGSSGDPTNLWDVVQGGTAAAREIGRTDDRVDAEKRWSHLLSYAGRIKPIDDSGDQAITVYTN